MNIFDAIPLNIINFILVTVFSLLIGLEQRRRFNEADASDATEMLFGTDRTFTFIGILGFILFVLDPKYMYLYYGGGLIVAFLLGIYYFQKIKMQGKYGLTTIFSALITYCLAPLIFTQPKWLVLLVVVTVLIFTELKASFVRISQKFEKDEFITLSKFIIIAGVILPLVNKEGAVTFWGVSAYDVWLAVVIISGISYLSYLLKKFVFKNSGVLFTGLLGGLYSSTATSVILAKKSREVGTLPHEYAGSIILATAMMYVRIFIIIAIFSRQLALILMPYFFGLFLVALLTGYFIYRSGSVSHADIQNHLGQDKNPLELKVAFIFAILYVFFTVVTQMTVKYYGEQGLNLLSGMVGLTDITPFLISLIQGKYSITEMMIAWATVQAMASNNLLKAAYIGFLAEKPVRSILFKGFAVVLAANIIVIILLRLH